MEYDHVAAVHLLIGQEPVPGARGPVNRLVDQQEVPHQQSPLHRFRGNAKGLHHKGEHKEGDDDDRQQRAEGVEQVGKDEVGVTMVDCAWATAGAAAAVATLASSVDTRKNSAGGWWVKNRYLLPTGSRAGVCFLSLSKARRAASCSARFLVVPTPRAIALGPLPSATLTSTRKRLR